MGETDSRRWYLSRRAFLAAGAGAALAACGHANSSAAPLQTQPTALPGALSGAIDAAEAARPHTGKTVTVALAPQPVTVDLGGRIATTMATPTPSPVR